MGWYFKNGSPSPFKMLEWYRRTLPGVPDTPQPKKRKRIKKGGDFKTKTSKSRKTKPANVRQLQGWIKELDAQIALASGGRKTQLEYQKANLARKLDKAQQK